MVEGLLERFHEEKRAYAQGQKDLLGQKPLSEALWTCEADLNFERGDARVVLDTLGYDSLIFVLPFEVNAEGIMLINDEDLILKQQDLLASGTLDATSNPIQFIDVALKEIDGSNAVFIARAYKRYVPYNVLVPPPVGCFDMEFSGTYPAEDVMNAWITYNWYIDMDIDPMYYTERPYYTNVGIQRWLSTLDWYDLQNNYTVYLGTRSSLGGPEWLKSLQSYEEVCFPDYWTDHLALKQWYYDQFAFTPGRVLVEQHYETNYMPRTGGPMDYGSPFYPMGPYDHVFFFRRAILRIPG